MRKGSRSWEAMRSDRTRQMWSVTSSSARLGGEGMGLPGPLDRQAHLGDFWIPQRGVFVVGMAFFEPFEEGRHLAVASRAS